MSVVFSNWVFKYKFIKKQMGAQLVREAMCTLKLRKSPGADVPLAELLKHEDVSDYMPAHLANQSLARTVDTIVGNTTVKERQPSSLNDQPDLTSQ